MCVECGQKIKIGIEVCTGSSNMEVIDILEESSFHGNREFPLYNRSNGE